MNLRGHKVEVKRDQLHQLYQSGWFSQVRAGCHKASGPVARHFVASMYLLSLVCRAPWAGCLDYSLPPCPPPTYLPPSPSKRADLMTKGWPQDLVSGDPLHSVLPETQEQQWPVLKNDRYLGVKCYVYINKLRYRVRSLFSSLLQVEIGRGERGASGNNGNILS